MSIIDMDKKKKSKRNAILLLSSIWFVVTLPLPWLIGNPSIQTEQWFTILPILGVISVPFVILGVAWTLKPELTT